MKKRTSYTPLQMAKHLHALCFSFKDSEVKIEKAKEIFFNAGMSATNTVMFLKVAHNYKLIYKDLLSDQIAQVYKDPVVNIIPGPVDTLISYLKMKNL